MTHVKTCSAYLHGWDFQSRFWHGPTPLEQSGRAVSATFRKLRNTTGSFNGKLRCSVEGLPSIEFDTAVYDRSDIGVAVIHAAGRSGGPVAVLAILPASRRKRLRAEFPFEFVTSLSFLAGPIKDGTELMVHDYVDEILRTDLSSTQAFAIEMAELNQEVTIVLSEYFELLSAAMLAWLTAKDTAGAELFEPANSQLCVDGDCVAA